MENRLLRIYIKGVVQGVGFRPFVYQIAVKNKLAGWVRNTSSGVEIVVEGPQQALDCFINDLSKKAPPLSNIEKLSIIDYDPYGYVEFKIRPSEAQEHEYQLISPDIATCGLCQEEIFSPANRRYRYPFTNCTNCGPRFTIIEDIPYDRPTTTMRSFHMCPQCQNEYNDPMDRRFHAQPNACALCGPSLQLMDASGENVQCDDVLSTTAGLLREGNIVAIKGLGGFLLACDATSNEAVGILRERKRRPYKPLAIMVSSMNNVQKYCIVSDKEEKLLASNQCPIVLTKKKTNTDISPIVAPNLKYLGIMLPYTPLHHVLLNEVAFPLVMTSGNLSEEPIAKDNDEALRRLNRIADYFLVHNRDIYSRYDDSVAMVELDKVQIVRRARGFAPYPIHLPFQCKQILACGPELKNTFCLTKDNYAFVSQHIGDMENLETLEHFESTIELYKKLFRINPEIVAYDMHPDYLATKYALTLKEKNNAMLFVPVQHHHAHIVSCIVENGIQETVIGVSLDGTGYGSDGRIWGGEFLITDYKDFKRFGHFEYIPMPGGAAAIKRPYRMTIGYLVTLLGEEALSDNLRFLDTIDDQELTLIERQLVQGINSPLTSSCGRLFDAVAALIGIRGVVEYEAQAAIELEMIAAEEEEGGYSFSIDDRDGMYIIKLKQLFRDILEDVQNGIPRSIISARFHSTIVEMIVKMCMLGKRDEHINRVALSGGVFQNRYLLRKTVMALQQTGFEVITHSKVPTNDGGISLGQAVIANIVAEGEGIGR